jgi:type I restriction enzyme, S subunit
LPSDWIKCCLADACSAINYGFTASASEVASGPRFLRITDIVSGHIDWTTVPYVVAQDQTLANYRLDHGDIVLARTGASTGASAYVKNPPSAVFASYLVRLRTKPEFDARFLSYYLKSDQFWNFIRGVLGDKSAQPNASAATMTKAPVLAPRDKAEQRAIAHILGTLDDKIELNRRTSETLEAMARALFKSWFVNFDPVRAKDEGRDPSLPQPLADLFPDRLVGSELGDMPDGWTVGTILAYARLISGGTPKTGRPEYWDGPIGWVSAKDVSQSKDLFLVETRRTITEKGLAESATRVVPALCSVVVARGATTGRIAILGRDLAMNQTCYALKSTIDAPFALHCQLREAIDALVHAAHGSIFNTITTRTFETSRVVLPSPRLLQEFEKLTSPLFLRMLSASVEARMLAALRDALLTKLVSGDMRIPDPERFVPAAVS